MKPSMNSSTLRVNHTESTVIGKRRSSDVVVTNWAIFWEEKILLKTKVTEGVTTLCSDRLYKILVAYETCELIWLRIVLLILMLVFNYFIDKLSFFLRLRSLFGRTFDQLIFLWLFDGWKLWKLDFLILVHRFENEKEFIKLNKESMYRKLQRESINKLDKCKKIKSGKY